MNHNLQFTLCYEGKGADRHEIDFYDVSKALIGFQRSVALTTHLFANNEIITKAPYLKGAKVVALPPEEGSWKITAGVILTGLYALGTAPNNTPVGHLVYSLYDYVVSESLGFHVDYNKSLGQAYEEAEENEVTLPVIKQHKADSLIEKCSVALSDMHRPIYKTKTAESASIVGIFGNHQQPLSAEFTQESFEYIHEAFIEETPVVIRGRISSYNSNNFRGRIYVAAEGRPVTFELAKSIRTEYVLQLVIASLSAATHKDYENKWIDIYCRAYRHTSRSGQLKEYTIIHVAHEEIKD